jgi:hypothetical protein
MAAPESLLIRQFRHLILYEHDAGRILMRMPDEDDDA